MCFAENLGYLLTSFRGDEAPGMTVEVQTPVTRSITTSPGRDLSLLALTGLACSGLAAAGCFLAALGGDGGPVESRQGRPGPAVLSLIVGRGLKRQHVRLAQPARARESCKERGKALQQVQYLARHTSH